MTQGELRQLQSGDKVMVWDDKHKWLLSVAYNDDGVVMFEDYFGDVSYLSYGTEQMRKALRKMVVPTS